MRPNVFYGEAALAFHGAMIGRVPAIWVRAKSGSLQAARIRDTSKERPSLFIWLLVKLHCSHFLRSYRWSLLLISLVRTEAELFLVFGSKLSTVSKETEATVVTKLRR